jgi:hypothetical protein
VVVFNVDCQIHGLRLTHAALTRVCRFLDGELVYKIEAAALNMSGGIIPEEPMYVSLLCVT